MRALVTGAGGFVGRYLISALKRHGAEVLPCGGPHDDSPELCTIDLLEAQSLQRPLESFRPTVVFHLAAQTFVPEAVRTPVHTYDVNVMGTARLAQAVRTVLGDSPPRLFFTSTASVYGARDESAEYPLHETLAPRPSDPYGASKAAAEALLLGESRAFGLDVVIARAFNHIGPGQSEQFVVASLASQLARIAAGATPQLRVGNLAGARDFLDVRDVVEAYVALARDGAKGEIYNVCSGRAVTIRDVLRELINIARVPVEVREAPELMRSIDVPIYVGTAEKLHARTGWKPSISLTRSLRDLYEAARSGVRAGRD